MQNKGLNRNIIDKYYTKKEIVELCINKIKENIKINKKDLIIEPSVGNGAFINNIKELSNNYIFIDIEPEQELENVNILKEDYLDFDYKNINNKKIHIIGNPPFGRQASMAIKFIKKSCEFANTISFILPKSYKKDSMKKYFNNYFHLILEEDLP
jgi:16S rRNA A1518/A1519 N6-dimethyltransferase RsmA/KsgA/DIM1 with predicted DNA glycosylase/AP lyase activity